MQECCPNCKLSTSNRSRLGQRKYNSNVATIRVAFSKTAVTKLGGRGIESFGQRNAERLKRQHEILRGIVCINLIRSVAYDLRFRGQVRTKILAPSWLSLDSSGTVPQDFRGALGKENFRATEAQKRFSVFLKRNYTNVFHLAYINVLKPWLNIRNQGSNAYLLYI